MKKVIIAIILFLLLVLSGLSADESFSDAGRWQFQHYPVISVFTDFKLVSAAWSNNSDPGKIQEIEFVGEGFANIIANRKSFKAVYKINSDTSQKWWDVFLTTDMSNMRLVVRKESSGLYFCYDLSRHRLNIFGERKGLIAPDGTEVIPDIFIYTGNIVRIE